MNRKADPVKELPSELVDEIFSYFSLQDIINCSRVSKTWYRSASSNHLWRPLCKLQGWNDCDRNVQHISGTNMEWKKYYILKKQIKNNWLKGIHQEYKLPLTLDEIASITCVTSSNRLLAYGCSNGELKVFEMKDAEVRLVQTIQCKEDAAITRIYISSKYLIFSQNLILFIFENREPCYEISLIKVMSANEALNIDDPSLYLGVNLEKTISEYMGNDSKFPIFRENALFGVKFVLVDDRLIATSSVSQQIHIWNLRTTKYQLLELDDNTQIGDMCVFKNVLYLSIILKKENKIFFHSMRVYIKAINLKNYTELCRSAPFRNYHEAIPALKVNNSYVMATFRKGSIWVFDRHTGKCYFSNLLLPDGWSVSNLLFGILEPNLRVFLDAYSEKSDLIGLVKEKGPSLQIVNPKSCSLIYVSNLIGKSWDICHDVLIHEIDCLVNFESVSSLQFRGLKNVNDSKGQRLTYIKEYSFKSLSECVFMDETKIVMFIENKFLYIISFIA